MDLDDPLSQPAHGIEPWVTAQCCREAQIRRCFEPVLQHRSDVQDSQHFGAVKMPCKEIIVLEHEPRKTPNSGTAVVELAAVGAAG